MYEQTRFQRFEADMESAYWKRKMEVYFQILYIERFFTPFLRNSK